MKDLDDYSKVATVGFPKSRRLIEMRFNSDKINNDSAIDGGITMRKNTVFSSNI